MYSQYWLFIQCTLCVSFNIEIIVIVNIETLSICPCVRLYVYLSICPCTFLYPSINVFLISLLLSLSLSLCSLFVSTYVKNQYCYITLGDVHTCVFVYACVCLCASICCMYVYGYGYVCVCVCVCVCVVITYRSDVDNVHIMSHNNGKNIEDIHGVRERQKGEDSKVCRIFKFHHHPRSPEPSWSYDSSQEPEERETDEGNVRRKTGEKEIRKIGKNLKRRGKKR